MAEIIKDGTGTGKSLKIDSNNRAQTHSVIQSEEAEIASRAGDAFIGSSSVITLNSTNPHLFLYVKNISSEKNLHFWVMSLGWNGGSTSHNRALKFSWVVNPDDPTANRTLVIPGNFNFNSSQEAEAIIYKWDGVGDGMTYSGGGIEAETLLSQGNREIESNGVPILGLNHSIGILFTGEEVGDASIVVRFFFK